MIQRIGVNNEESLEKDLNVIGNLWKGEDIDQDTPNNKELMKRRKLSAGEEVVLIYDVSVGFIQQSAKFKEYRSIIYNKKLRFRLDVSKEYRFN